MIIRTLTIAALMFAALGISNPAHGDVFGPACWQLGRQEIYRLFFVVDPANPVVAPVAGEVLAVGIDPLPVSGSAIPSAASQTVRMGLTVAAGFGSSTTYFVRADFSFDDLTGQAVCQLANGDPGGCDQGSLAWTPVECPR